jgi:NitT/TauT family transport system substrate-binding protein
MAERLRRIEYGAPTDRCSATVLLGIDKGFFRDEGIDLALRVIYGGPELLTAYDSGSLPFGEIGSPPAITAISRGARFTVVGGGLRRGALMFLGVRSDIRTWMALRGKRIGVLSIGSCTDWVGRAILGANGLIAGTDVEMVPLKQDYADILSVIQKGQVDGVVAGEPHLAIGEAAGLLRVWCAAHEEGLLPRFQWYVLVANNEFLTAEPDLVAALLRAYRRASHYAVAHLDQLVACSVHYYGIPHDAARRAVERELPHLHLDAAIDVLGLQRAVELQRQLGGVTEPFEAMQMLSPTLCALDE